MVPRILTGEFRGLAASSERVEKNLPPVEAGLFLDSRLRGGWRRAPGGPWLSINIIMYL